MFSHESWAWLSQWQRMGCLCILHGSNFYSVAEAANGGLEVMMETEYIMFLSRCLELALSLNDSGNDSDWEKRTTEDGRLLSPE